jgi:hypothetical protein
MKLRESAKQIVDLMHERDAALSRAQAAEAEVRRLRADLCPLCSLVDEVGSISASLTPAAKEDDHG